MNAPPIEKLERRPGGGLFHGWSSKSRWTSWLISTLAHAAMIVSLALIYRPLSKGTQGQANRPIGIAVVHLSQDATEVYSDAGGKGAEVVDQPAAAAFAKSLTAIRTSKPNGTMSVEELLGEFSGIGKAPLGGDASGIGQGSAGLSGIGSSGTGSGKGKSGGTKTSIFGIEGSGNSFVYVFDRSDSMNEFAGAPLRMAKGELAQSIESLSSVNQFQIIFYSEAPSPYRGSLSRTQKLIFATDTEKQSASSFVQGITGSGGTEHLPALRMGVNLGSDVIFFLTDAADPRLSQSEIDELSERCISRRTTIHSIEFGTGENPGSDRWIEQLARRTGGKYRYIDVTNIDR